MTTFFRTVPTEEATGKLKELYDEDIRLHGRVLGATEMLSLRPEVTEAWRAMDSALRSTIDPRHYELATLAAAISVGCSA
jgi:alkylhydroperoxidase/carboxymuconolactone decarboxylase family protein YurZ